SPEAFAEELSHGRAVDHHPVHVDVDLVAATPVGHDRAALVAHDQRLRAVLAHRVGLARTDWPAGRPVALGTSPGSQGVGPSLSASRTLSGASAERTDLGQL